MATIVIMIAIGIFATGAVAGLIGRVSIGIRREERAFTLTRQAPDQVTEDARTATGLYVRQRRDVPPARAPWEDMLV